MCKARSRGFWILDSGCPIHVSTLIEWTNGVRCRTEEKISKIQPANSREGPNSESKLQTERDRNDHDKISCLHYVLGNKTCYLSAAASLFHLFH